MSTLKLGKNSFTYDKNTSYLEYSVENNKIVSCNLEINFLEGQFYNEGVSPTIFINDIELDKKNLKDLKGILLKTNTPEQSDEREDYLQLIESEPFEKLTIEVLDINDYSADIKLKGIAITNGYSKPYKKESFELEVKINVKKYERKNNIEKDNHVKKTKDFYTVLIINTIFIVIGLIAIIAVNEKISGTILITMGLLLLLLSVIGTKNKS